MNQKVFNKKTLPCFAALALALALPISANAVDGFSVEAGSGDGVDMARVGVQWDWQKTWLQRGDWHLGGYWDLQLGRWNGASHITDLGLTPTFRWENDSRRGGYLEAAIGFHYLSSRNVTSAKQLGSNFEFGDHVGAGYRFGEKGAYDVSLRFQHLSNAGIKHPNPGINFTQLRFQYHF